MLGFAVCGVIALAFAMAWHLALTAKIEREAKRSLDLLHDRIKRIEKLTHFPLDPPRSSFDLDPNRKLTETPR